MKYDRISSVLDFEGSVSMICDYWNDKGQVFNQVLSQWTLDDVCGKVTWTQKFNLEVDVLIIDRVLLYLGVGQFFAATYDDGKNIFYKYDYTKKETTKFPSLAHHS